LQRIYRALTIAGSDSGGGAGIQADLKTFAALGVYGMSVITAITAQNTTSVAAIQDVDPDVVKAQFEAVISDIGTDAVKTGMLYKAEIIDVVGEEIQRHHLKTVMDPVMIAKSGAKLLRSDATSALVEKLLPYVEVVTPNAPEASELSGIEVKDRETAEEAAKKISALGPKAVVVKGGHIPSQGKVADLLYENGKMHVFEVEELSKKTTHGTGCTFSSAITAYLAKGSEIPEAVHLAQQFVFKAIKFGIPVGQGHGPVNPMAEIYAEAERWSVLKNLSTAVDILESYHDVASIIPEVNSNLAMASTYAMNVSDVAGIPGRIVRLGRGVKAMSCPTFGGSRHIANTILVAQNYNPEIRAAMNIRYSEEILSKLKSLGFSASAYDRTKEPQEIKKMEGMTTRWGAEEAIKSIGRVPDAVYHEGDWGKEAMVIILGRDAIEVVNRVITVAKSLSRS
jgi:hydroxymethylpyrimidine kinase/phosphomethylpyrimidine kinase